MVTRLRMGGLGHGSSVALMGKGNTDNCESCDVKENAEHIILKCKKEEGRRMNV